MYRYGSDKPSVIEIAGHPFPLCFTQAETEGEHHMHDASHHHADIKHDLDDHFSCSAKRDSARRLCACIPRHLFWEEREQMRQRILDEQRSQQAEVR